MILLSHLCSPLFNREPEWPVKTSVTSKLIMWFKSKNRPQCFPSASRSYMMPRPLSSNRVSSYFHITQYTPASLVFFPLLEYGHCIVALVQEGLESWSLREGCFKKESTTSCLSMFVSQSHTKLGKTEVSRPSDNSSFSGGRGSFIVVGGGKKRRQRRERCHGRQLFWGILLWRRTEKWGSSWRGVCVVKDKLF